MKINKLTMEGFGSFTVKTELDFSAYKEAGLILISGKTGSGKTTIFDAISFALFGQASGGYREGHETSLVSQHLDNNIKPFVELEFETKGNKYKIYRSLPYMAKMKNKDGYVEKKKESALTLPGGKIIEKTREVDAAVKEILGLDKKQFAHIAMIAQGAFVDLVNASTDERLNILKNIFDTSIFNMLQNELSDLEKVYSANLNNIRSLCQSSIDSTDFSSLPNINLPSVEVIFADEKDQFIKELKDAVKLTEKEQSQREENIFALEASKVGVENQIKYEKKKIDVKKSILEEQRNLHSLNADIKALKDKRKDIIAGKPIYDKNKELLSEYNKSAKILDEIQEKSISKSDIEKTVIQEKNRLDKINNDLEHLQVEKEKINKSISTMESAKNRKLLIMPMISNLEKEKEALEYIIDGISQYASLNEKIKCDEQNLKLAREIFEDHVSAYELMQKSFVENQAFVLAENLQQGHPCPVCGSTHHPNPASISQSKIYSQKEIKIAENKVHTEQKNLIEIDAAIKTMNLQLSELANNLIKRCKSDNVAYIIDKAHDYKDDCDHIIRQLKSLSDEIDNIDEHIAKEGEIKKKLVDIDSLIEENKKNIEDINRNISNYTIKLKSLESSIDTLLRNLPSPDVNFINEKITQLTKYISEFEESKAKIDESYENVLINISAKEGLIKGLESQLSDWTPCDLKQLEADKCSINEKILLLKEEVGTVSGFLIKLKELVANVLSLKKEYLNINKKAKEVMALSKVANGQVSKQGRIKLETYVLQRYFAKVISLANSKLYNMTEGQYELRIKTQAEDRRSNYGLDLNIFDRNSGKERASGTLSGGETFKVALALAQGLAQLIQMQAGGIEIDSIFIDEGFGTLDEDSLPSALKMLEELAKGNTKVFIISHVQSLKDRINMQLSVEKSDFTSTAKIISA